MKHRKILALAVALVLTVSAAVPAAAATLPFGDQIADYFNVTEGSTTYYQVMDELLGDDKDDSDAAVTFADAADIKNLDSVNTLVKLGVINGITQADGTVIFAPSQTITREQMAKMVAALYSLAAGQEIGTDASAFTDAAGRWSEPYIAFCAKKGIINGRSDTLFDCEGTITVTETAKLLLAAAGMDNLVGTDWKESTLTAANAIGLLEGVTSGMDDPITRDEAALVLGRAVSYLEAFLKMAASAQAGNEGA